MDALPKPVATLSHSSSIENSLEQYLPSFRPHLFFTALTAFYVLLVPMMGRAENQYRQGDVDCGKRDWSWSISTTYIITTTTSFVLLLPYTYPSRLSYRVSYIVLLASACTSACTSASAFFSSYCTRPPLIPQASSTHGNCMLPDYLGRRRYIPWSRVGRTREESEKQKKKKKKKEKSPSLTTEQQNQPHQRELQQRQRPSSSQHQPRMFH